MVPVGGSCCDIASACARFSFRFFMRVLLRGGQNHVLLLALTAFSCPVIISASLQQALLPSLVVLVAKCFPTALRDPSGSTATLGLCVLRTKCNTVGLTCGTPSDCWAGPFLLREESREAEGCVGVIWGNGGMKREERAQGQTLGWW